MLVWLDQVECQEVTLVGGKAANLSRLLALPLVPPGFCLTTEAHAQWAVGQEANTVPDAARELLTTAYATLAARCQMAEPHVAVHSSGRDGWVCGGRTGCVRELAGASGQEDVGRVTY